MPGNHELPNRINVSVITTSGPWPAQGFEQVPNHQPVRVFLEKALRQLGIVSAEDWIATVAGTAINVSASYIDNHLSGNIAIDYGPRAAGGGRA